MALPTDQKLLSAVDLEGSDTFPRGR